MVSKKELRGIGRDLKAAKVQSQIAAVNDGTVRKTNRTQRKIDQTANIKARKGEQLGNISARRANRKTRTDRGDGVKIAGRVADSYDTTVREAGQTIRDPNTSKTIRAAKWGF